MELVLFILLAAWLTHVVRQQIALARAEAASLNNKPVPPAIKLTLDGVKPVRGDLRFVRQFGLPATALCDVGCFQGPAKLADLPGQLQECLQRLYQEGGHRGPEILDFIFRGAELKGDQALYFAAFNQPRAELAAFIYKHPKALSLVG